jgi:hypothetical protein
MSCIIFCMSSGTFPGLRFLSHRRVKWSTELQFLKAHLLLNLPVEPRSQPFSALCIIPSLVLTVDFALSSSREMNVSSFDIFLSIVSIMVYVLVISCTFSGCSCMPSFFLLIHSSFILSIPSFNSAFLILISSDNLKLRSNVL